MPWYDGPIDGEEQRQRRCFDPRKRTANNAYFNELLIEANLVLS